MNQWAGGANAAGAEKQRLDEPPVVYMRCSEHGVERFFLADMMCTRCEREYLGILNADEFITLGDGESGSGSGSGSGSDEDGAGAAAAGRPLSISKARRKSSFAFH